MNSDRVSKPCSGSPTSLRSKVWAPRSVTSKAQFRDGCYKARASRFRSLGQAFESVERGECSPGLLPLPESAARVSRRQLFHPCPAIVTRAVFYGDKWTRRRRL